MLKGIQLTMSRKPSFSLMVVFLLLASLLYSIFNLKFWKQEGQVIKYDVLEYYGYLPSAFIYKDLSLKFTEKSDIDWGKRIWALTAPNGKKVFKMSMGMSIMYAPFFGMAHCYTKSTGKIADGFSSPYKFAILMSSVFYLMLCLFYLRKTLLLFFNDWITGFTLLVVVAGTNLWYYASFEAPLSHAYSFSLIAIFVWFVIRYYRKPGYGFSVLLGLLFGLISLIRPSNAIIALVFIFWGISSWLNFKDRVNFLLSQYKQIFTLVFCSFLVWLPQSLYWHMQTGQWLYFSYAENGAFYFFDPQIINGLFSYRKGWFLYTPLMLIAVLAIPLTWKHVREFTFPLAVFVPLNVYVILSWWCWWYGGCFGQRSFIDSYALLAIPMAACLQWLWQKKWATKLMGYFLISTLTIFGIFHTAKYYYGSIHWDSMTKEAYWGSFIHLRPGPNFQRQIKEPDYDKALRGEEEY